MPFVCQTRPHLCRILRKRGGGAHCGAERAGHRGSSDRISAASPPVVRVSIFPFRQTLQCTPRARSADCTAPHQVGGWAREACRLVSTARPGKRVLRSYRYRLWFHNTLGPRSGTAHQMRQEGYNPEYRLPRGCSRPRRHHTRSPYSCAASRRVSKMRRVVKPQLAPPTGSTGHE